MSTCRTYGQLSSLLGERLPLLRPRQLAAIAGTALDRLHAAAGPTFHGEGWADVDNAIEMVWAFVDGRDVSPDEYRARKTALDDVLDDVYHNVAAHERCLVVAALYGTEVLADGGAVATKRVVHQVVDAADYLGGGAEESPEAEWLGGLVARVARTGAGAALRRDALSWPAMAVPRWVVRGWEELTDDQDDPEDLATLQSELGTTFAAGTTARHRRYRERAAEQSFAPYREPSGMPATLDVRKVAQAPASSQGVVSVSGHDYVGVFAAGEGDCLFAPPSAVQLGMSPEAGLLISWRVDKRAGASGICRADYDWIIERYRWPEPELVDRHTIATRTIVDWCWPGRLVVSAQGEGNHVELVAHNEDETSRLHLVFAADGVRETEDRDQAQAWLGVTASKSAATPPTRAQ